MKCFILTVILFCIVYVFTLFFVLVSILLHAILYYFIYCKLIFYDYVRICSSTFLKVIEGVIDAPLE